MTYVCRVPICHIVGAGGRHMGGNRDRFRRAENQASQGAGRGIVVLFTGEDYGIYEQHEGKMILRRMPMEFCQPLRYTLRRSQNEDLVVRKEHVQGTRSIGNIAAISRNRFPLCFGTDSNKSLLASVPTLLENPSWQPGIPVPHQPGSFLGR